VTVKIVHQHVSGRRYPFSCHCGLYVMPAVLEHHINTFVRRTAWACIEAEACWL